MAVATMVVPKAPIPVELRDSAGRQSAGVVYVCDGGTETLLSVLTARRFIPVRGADGCVSMFHREHLLWVRLDLLTAIDEMDSDIESAEASRVARIRVVMEDSTEIDGRVRYLRPPESQRLSDYLESAPAYFPVRTADHVYLVNRARVVAVTPVVEVAS